LLLYDHRTMLLYCEVLVLFHSVRNSIAREKMTAKTENDNFLPLVSAVPLHEGSEVKWPEVFVHVAEPCSCWMIRLLVAV